MKVLKNENVKHFTILNGMEVIATLLEEKNDRFVVKNAWAFNVVQNDTIDPSTNQPITKNALTVAPPTIFAELKGENGKEGAELEIMKSAVVFTYPPKEDIYEQYSNIIGKINIISAR